MGLIIWPALWIVFILGLWVAFGVVAYKESRARAQAAREALASQQAMAAAGADMAPPGGAGGFDDGFGDAGQPEFADFDENAFK